MKTKIFIIIISCFCIWNLAVYANNGDISSTLYNTDIITYFDGIFVGRKNDDLLGRSEELWIYSRI